ncbi:MAG TPA: pyrimidine reductase family protein [Microbacterium sp.]|uniref:pyrimidine reductase family protein n=1 Tax=Microbacterium sp. TaxID=51671 RepID=UPI002B47BD88|nr:pyrimidine reductase family protein [Microbacterium sp.]HKT56399.1 pyrimidine reductase family protein [Microbacterium sp.]
MPTRTDLFDAYALPDRTRPRVRVNFVSSADGAVTLEGRSGALGGETDRAVMQVLRTMSDVVLVGAGTVRAEGYGGLRVDDRDADWRRDRGLPDQPVLAMVSGSLGLGPDDAVFAQAVRRPVIVTTERAARARGADFAAVADVIACGEASLDLAAMRDAFAGRGWTQVLCEGGPHLFGALLEAGLVDEVCVTLAPRFVGGDAGRIVRGAAEADRPFDLAGILTDDEGFVFLRYALS